MDKPPLGILVAHFIRMRVGGNPLFVMLLLILGLQYAHKKLVAKKNIEILPPKNVEAPCELVFNHDK